MILLTPFMLPSKAAFSCTKIMTKTSRRSWSDEVYRRYSMMGQYMLPSSICTREATDSWRAVARYSWRHSYACSYIGHQRYTTVIEHYYM